MLAIELVVENPDQRLHCKLRLASPAKQRLDLSFELVRLIADVLNELFATVLRVSQHPARLELGAVSDFIGQLRRGNQRTLNVALAIHLRRDRCLKPFDFTAQSIDLPARLVIFAGELRERRDDLRAIEPSKYHTEAGVPPPVSSKFTGHGVLTSGSTGRYHNFRHCAGAK